LRLIIQPYIFYSLIKPWLQVFKIPGFQQCFLKLIDIMNEFRDFSVLKAFTISPLFAIAC
jgi:hypothetical protein